MPSSCPLCSSDSVNFQFHQPLHKRDFYLCENCDLSFVDRAQLLDLKTEKSRYDLHQNDIRSAGYEKFLRRLVNPIIGQFSLDAQGLDYGQGPYPMLLEIMREEGFKNLVGHDPIYHPDQAVFKASYDFITMCEVIEHIYDLKTDLDALVALLRPSAWWVVSTGIKIPGADISKWHYILDDTHINLFSELTFSWMEKEYSLTRVKLDKSLVIFSKK